MTQNSLEGYSGIESDPLREMEKARDIMHARAEIIARHKIVYICCIPSAVREGEFNLSDLSTADAERVQNILTEHTFDDTNWARAKLGSDFQSNPSRLEAVYATEGNTFPSFDDISGIIIGGSPSMLTTDTDPWIERIERYVHEAAKKKIPILGICFGHQLLAKTFGGSIGRTEKREMGTVQVDLSEEGKADPLFCGVSSPLQVLEGHSEIVSDPPNMSVRLAFNEHNLNQALAIKPNIRGVQFHPEIPKEVIEAAALLREKGLLKEGLNAREIIEGLRDTPDAENVLRNFDTYFVTKYALSDKS